MKKLNEILMKPGGSAEILMGNHALVRAMIESGVRAVSSYPGSPTPEIAAAIATIPKDDCPFYFEFSVNEKVATEVAFGASLNGHLSTVFFKSVGLNVASDTFVQLAYMNLPGGMVIVIGDDPGANSSQNEQDNRHLAKLAYMPVFEPATAGELYSMFKEAAGLSRRLRMPVILRSTTHVCHAKEKIEMEPREIAEFDDTPRFDPGNGPYIPIASAVFPMKRRALSNLAEVAEYAEQSAFNVIEDNGNRERGVIVTGLPYLSLKDVLEETQRKPDILKLGLSYPLPTNLVLDFLRQHREVKVLDELDDILEQQIKTWAYDHGLNTKISGKLDIEDWIGEYTPGKVGDVLRRTWPDLLPSKTERPAPSVSIEPRPAQMCPGCGHRSAFHAIKQSLGENDITVADIGCHTLGFLPPYNVGQVLLCMGHSNGTAAGLGLYNETRKIVAFLGDSTFYHAGLPGIVNSIFNKHSHTLVIMDNGTTAMTGHQNHPGTGRNFYELTERLPIRKVLEGLGVKHIAEVDTYRQDKLKDAVVEAMEKDEFSVVIAKHPCMLKFARNQRRRGKQLPAPVEVSGRCDKRYVCVSEFACPSYQLDDDGTVWVQKDLCIGDGSCIQTCPVKAIEAAKGGADGIG